MGAKIIAKWATLLVVVLLTGWGCALHDDIVIVDKRLAALKNKVAKQEESVEALRSEISGRHESQSKSDEVSRDKHADVSAFMNDLRDEIQSLRGQLEEVRYATQQKMGAVTLSESKREDRWKALEQSMQASLDRIVRLEEHLGMEPSEKMAVPKSPPVESSQDKPPPKTPDALYAQAKEKFDRGEYETARELFQAFLKDHPKSENADNAQFWVGEVYYREKWYEKAILEYQKVIEGYPKGNKLRSALLKQGFAFLNLGDKDNTKLILKELVRKYPDSSEAKIAKEKLDKLQ